MIQAQLNLLVILFCLSLLQACKPQAAHESVPTPAPTPDHVVPSETAIPSPTPKHESVPTPTSIPDHVVPSETAIPSPTPKHESVPTPTPTPDHVVPSETAIPSPTPKQESVKEGTDSVVTGHTPGLPDGPHPRIWITSAELTRLTNKREARDPEWTALFNWCEKHLEDRGFNIDPAKQDSQDLTYWSGDNAYNEYRMSGYYLHLMSYALAYQVLMAPGPNCNPSRAAQYASRVRTLLIHGIAESLRAGEEPNGLKALRVGLHDTTTNAAEAQILGIGKARYKLGYSSRFLAAVPIAYDWVYDTFSQEEKKVLTSMMLRWFDWIRGVRSPYNNGVLVNEIRYHEDQNGSCNGANICTSLVGEATVANDYGNLAGNFGGGHTYLMSLIAAALYGENADTPAYFAGFHTFLINTVIDQLESDLKHSGGDSVEGWNYGGGFQYTLLGLYGYFTATDDPKIPKMLWPSSLIDAMAHRLAGNYLDVPLYGSWTGIPLGKNRIGTALPLVGIEQKLRPNSTLSRVGQYLLHQVKFEDSADDWKRVLWHDRNIPEMSPIGLSLSYLAKGNGYFTSKSSWTDPNAVLIGVRLEGKYTCDHEGYDEGDISILRGADRLLTHQNSLGDGAAAVSFNTIVFNNKNHTPINAPLKKPAVDRVESGTNYAYVSGDITNSWQRPGKAVDAKLFRRSVLHILPGWTVVYDVTQSNSAIGNRKEWYTQYLIEPEISGETISATVGNSKLFVKTLFPSSGTFTSSNPSPGYYRVSYTPLADQEYDQFLHLVSATDRGRANPDPSELISNGNVRGVHIKNASENIVAVFTEDRQGAAVAGIVNYCYSPTSTRTTHYIADLPLGQRYDVAVAGQNERCLTLTPAVVGSLQASSSGGLLILSTN